MSGDSLENRVGKIKGSIKCDHRKSDDFTYHHYAKNGLELEAYLCSQCLPRYDGMLKGYLKAIEESKNENDDDFDEREMCFRYSEDK